MLKFLSDDILDNVCMDLYSQWDQLRGYGDGREKPIERHVKAAFNELRKRPGHEWSYEWYRNEVESA